MFFNLFKNRIESGDEPVKCVEKKESNTSNHSYTVDVAKAKNSPKTFFATHYDLIDFCYDQIADTFHQVGAIAPSAADLASAQDKFNTCQTQNKKLKGKIGYKIDFDWKNDHPTFFLTVHSFKGGSHSATLSSWDVVQPLLLESNNKPSEAQALVAAQKQKRQEKLNEQRRLEAIAKKEKEDKEKWRQQEFKRVYDLYLGGSSELVGQHSYMQSKEITLFSDMRVIHGGLLCIPLHTCNFQHLKDLRTKHPERITSKPTQIVGFQTIDSFGNKKLVISKEGDTKGAFGIVRGNLLQASQIIQGEGLASTEKAFKLSNANSACAIYAISAMNMKPVRTQIEKFLEKAGKPRNVIIAADNDAFKQSKGKGNAGIRHALLAYFIKESNASFVLPEVTGSQTDWDDLYRENKPEAKKQFRLAKANQLDKLTLATMLLSAFPNKEYGSINAVHKALTLLAKRIISLSPLLPIDDLIDALYEAAKHTGVEKIKIENVFKTAFDRYAKAANEVRTISDKYVDQKLHADSIDGANVMIEALKKEHDQLIVLLKAEMGSGKTQSVLKPQFQQEEAQGHFPISLSPTRSLTKSLSETINSSHYVDDKDHDFSLRQSATNRLAATGLSSTINSLINARFSEFTIRCSAVFIDEATQVLRAIPMGTVANHAKRTTEQKLAELIGRSKFTFFADADMNDTIAQYVQERAPENAHIVVIEVKPKVRDDLTYCFYGDKDAELNHARNLKAVQKNLQNGEHVFCTTDSRVQAEALKKMATDKAGIDEKNILLVSSLTVNTEQAQAFFTNPDKYITDHNIKLLIATPAVQSGISIQQPHFTKAHVFYRGTVTPTDIQQMAHRVRYLKTFVWSLPCPTPRYDEYHENAEYIYLETLKFFISNNLANLRSDVNITELEVIDGKVALDENIEVYERLSANLQAQEIKQLNNAANFVLLQAHGKGINLIDLNKGKPLPDDETKKEIKKDNKELKTAVKEEAILAVAGENTLFKEEYNELCRNEQSLTPEKQILKKRYEVSIMAGNDEVTEDDVKFFDKSGNAKIMNYVDALDVLPSYKKDEEEIKNDIARGDRSKHSYKAILLQHLYTHLNIDEVNLTGSFNSIQAQKLKQVLLADEKLLYVLKHDFNINLDENYLPMRLVSLLFKKLLGLKTKVIARCRCDDRVQTYALDAEEVARFLHYAEVKQQRLQHEAIALQVA